MFGKIDTLKCETHAEKLATFEKNLQEIKAERISDIKKSQWKVAIICSVPGAVFAVIKILEHFSK